MDHSWEVSFFLKTFLPPFLAIFSYHQSRDCSADTAAWKKERKRFF